MPLFFAVVIDVAAELVREASLSVLLYADDLVLIIEGSVAPNGFSGCTVADLLS